MAKQIEGRRLALLRESPFSDTSLVGWLVGWLVDWFICWLVGWLVGWLVWWLFG